MTKRAEPNPEPAPDGYYGGHCSDTDPKPRKRANRNRMPRIPRTLEGLDEEIDKYKSILAILEAARETYFKFNPGPNPG